MSTPAPRLQLHDPRLMIVSVATLAFNASGLKGGAGYLAPKTGNVRYIGVATSAKTGTSPTYDLRLETMTAGAATPTGTLFGTTTNVTTQLNGGANTFTWYQLTADAAVTAGNAMFAVVNYSSGTIDASNFVTLVLGSTGTGQCEPYYGSHNGTSWTMSQGSPAICLKYDDGTIIQGCLPIKQHQLGTFYGSASSPNERCLVFTPPFDCEVSGLRAIGVINDLTNATISINVYAGTSTTPTATYTPSRPMATASSIGSIWEWSFPAVSLVGGQSYRISLKGTGSTQIGLYRLSFASTAERDASFGPGYSGTRGGGAWTDSTTDVDLMVPILSTVTVPPRSILTSPLISAA